MTITSGQLSTLRRRLEDAADGDAKKQAGVFTLFDLSVQLSVLHDGAIVAVDSAVESAVSERAAMTLDDEQTRLLRLYYIRRRMGIEIDRLEELAIEARRQDV